MKTLILGYAENLKGPATLIAGPEVAARDQLRIINDAKREGKYPDGINSMELCLAQPQTIAINTNPVKSVKKK